MAAISLGGPGGRLLYNWFYIKILFLQLLSNFVLKICQFWGLNISKIVFLRCVHQVHFMLFLLLPSSTLSLNSSAHSAQLSEVMFFSAEWATRQNAGLLQL